MKKFKCVHLQLGLDIVNEKSFGIENFLQETETNVRVFKCTKKIFFNNCSFVDKQKHVLRSEPCWRNIGPFQSNLVGGKLIGRIALKANFVIYLRSCVGLFVIFSRELHLRNLYLLFIGGILIGGKLCIKGGTMLKVSCVI